MCSTRFGHGCFSAPTGIGTQPDVGLVNTMLDAAIETVTDAEGGTIVHSDRGAHYRWLGWLTRISDAASKVGRRTTSQVSTSSSLMNSVRVTTESEGVRPRNSLQRIPH
ncbi:hypothetical protein BSK43_015680 [Rhizobium sp. P44RR-XXIV]|nr:hypothetical protein BSK43_015680 [Rhizobium sp. P44RR-XXIV]